jgi:hypothetical protein
VSYVRPDVITRVPITGGELKLSSAYDTVHLFQPLGAAMLKYWNTDGGGMSNVLMELDQALLLAKVGQLAIIERPFIMVSEHESLVGWRAANLNEGEFGLE